MKRDPLLMTILAALAVSCGPEPTKGEGCMDVEATVTECPHSNQVALDDLFLPNNCDEEIVSKSGEGIRKTYTGQDGVERPTCCYAVEKIDPDPEVECVVGRPFKENGRSLSAPVRLSAEERATAWALAAAGEHASVAAFSRLSLQLMAHGAPLELLEATHQAALDEVRHTRICLDMAERSGATAVSLGTFPFSRSVAVDTPLAEIAVDAVREGCITETLGAYAAREAAERAREPEVRDAMLALADDEARHAALSYRIVAWALEVGGSDVRTAVVQALALPSERLNTAELAARVGVTPDELAELQNEGLRRVVRPALNALLAA